jgi:16S rRNA (uracil1498-N3)-methyltransferase
VNVFIAEIDQNKAFLTAEESWHCAKVLRCKAGEAIHLIDGRGHFYKAELLSVNEKKCEALVTSGPTLQPKRDYYLHLAIAPTKNIDRIEWLVEKAVEIGIDELTFIRCKNSERTVIKIDRIHKIVESAVKQSLQAYLPKVNELVDFSKLFSIPSDLKLIAHCMDGDKSHIRSLHIKNKKSLVVIGPEGDFTEQEVKTALENNFSPITLGANRLRTETAGLFVCNAFALS